MGINKRRQLQQDKFGGVRTTWMLLNVRLVVFWGEGCYSKTTYKSSTGIGQLKFQVSYFNNNSNNNENNNKSFFEA